MVTTALSAQQPSAEQIILDAINHERDTSSYSVITMTIHRPDWQRSMTMKSWTKGMKKSLVRVIEPKKDAGSGNLLIDESMWSYAPKINRVIKLPSSMMNQSWMGSDFTNNDLAKADDIVDYYNHNLVDVREHNGKKLYVIESIPKDTAPVVWGKEIVEVREDRVMLGHKFYDQDGKLVKRLEVNEVKNMDGKLVASSIRMLNVEESEHWTEVKIEEARFGVDLPERIFTLSNLRNPRQGY
ncbi:MAG: outer membrane lipoprotein-sorting protein [Gammaproteobacteria bacterium]|nr:outer membrane lipoprotein-sorting protein [Gammaproteobacteria bacterium]